MKQEGRLIFPNARAEELAEPYPVLEVQHRSAQYARIMEQNIGSTRGEMSAASQYLYQSWVLEPGYAALAEVCRRIAQVEMRHLDIFGKLSELLGGTPRLAAPSVNGHQPWNGNMLFYTRDPIAMLRHNVAEEQAAAEMYEAQAAQIYDPQVAAMLRRIARTERLHREIFQSWLESLGG